MPVGERRETIHTDVQLRTGSESGSSESGPSLTWERTDTDPLFKKYREKYGIKQED